MKKNVSTCKRWCGVWGCVAALVTILSGCGSPTPLENVPIEEVSILPSRSVNFAAATWQPITPPVSANVDLSSMQIIAMSADGQVIAGGAVCAENNGSVMDLFRKPFWWHLGRNEWVWLPIGETDLGIADMNQRGDVVLGRQWVWENGDQKVRPLGHKFWGYAIQDDGTLLGVDLNRHIVMRSIDGSISESWSVDELFSVDIKGHVQEQMWFAEDGIIYSSIRQCVLNQSCDEAYLIRWSPESGKEVIAAQLPQRTENFIQSNPGPQVVSSNGLWLAGSVGQGVYIWDVQGQSRFIGGFEEGAQVIGISNDGLVAVGEAIDPKTGLERAWIWTATEGLGFLDEWLRDHGVDRENLNREMQVQRLSADRRVLIGFTPSYDNVGRVGPPQWWRIDLSEHLRVLM